MVPRPGSRSEAGACPPFRLQANPAVTDVALVALRPVTGQKSRHGAIGDTRDLGLRKAVLHAEDGALEEIGLAQLDELVGGKIEILDDKLPARHRRLQIAAQPGRPISGPLS